MIKLKLTQGHRILFVGLLKKRLTFFHALFFVLNNLDFIPSDAILKTVQKRPIFFVNK